MQLILDLPDNKANAFIAFLKTIEFVKVKKSNDDFELTQAQKEELDRRFENYKSNPSSAIEWDVVKADIEKRL